MSDSVYWAGRACMKDVITCFTPTVFLGKFNSLFLRVGVGGKYTNLEVVPSEVSASPVPSVSPSPGASSIPLPEPQGTDTAIFNSTFSFSDPLTLSKSFSCCGGSTWKDHEANYKDLLWTLGWVEATFVNPGGLSGTYTFRLVYATSATSGYVKGDILIKDVSDGGTFKWCPIGATSMASCSTTRPASPIKQDTGIVNYTPEAGSPTLPYLTAEVFPDATGTGTLSPPALTTFLTKKWVYTVDFDVTGSFAALQSNPGTDITFTSAQDMMSKIFLRGLSAYPAGAKFTDGTSKVGGGIAAVLTVTSE